MNIKKLAASLTAAIAVSGAQVQAAEPAQAPTVVLVHGAFADSSSWNGVAARLKADGVKVVAAANPLRSVAEEALAPPATIPGGGKDLYIDQDKFWKQFAADVDQSEAQVMAVAQRPIAEAALGEASQHALWKQLPSYFVYGTADKNIPAAALEFMAKRAGSRKTVVVKDASHVVMTSNPAPVAELIERAIAEQS